jgi:hypothetical protein
MPQSTENTRLAIEFLTVWMDDSDEEMAFSHITNVICANRPEVSALEMSAAAVTGLLNVSKILLVRLAQARGAMSDAEIQDKASEILCELSLRLPE